MSADPHGGQPIVTAGAPLPQARAAMVMVHGRGATAPSIASLSREFQAPGMAFLAPQAAGNTWYPHSFMSPIPSNEPGITSGMAAINDLLKRIVDSGVALERTMLL